tara:strand:- start:193977 stop:195593 length:1617 start_codon:yes stop_codon:yes gene_type:complete
MKTKKTLLLVLMIICSFCEIHAQPGEESDKKYNLHEIKLQEREDGSRVGAIAWTTTSSDSLQKFVIRNLSIMEPVQVILQSLSPNDEVTLQFVKEKWSEPESSISAKGKTIGKRIFRTYKTAALSINAKKAGIPYLILVQVGKKLPVNSTPLFKFTINKKEFENYAKNKSKNTKDSEMETTSISNNESGNGNSAGNSTLLYIIIGLLALLMVLLCYFIFIRKGSKKVLMIIFLIVLSINPVSSQEMGPIQIPFEPTGDGSSTTDAGITGLVNQTLIVDLYKRLSEQATKMANLEDNYSYLNEQLNALYDTVYEGLADLSEADSYLDEAYLELKNEFNQFKNDFVDHMPGQDTDEGHRALPLGANEVELNQIKRRIRDLEEKVAFLSNRDRNYAPADDDQESVLVYCEEIRDCAMCLGDKAGAIIDVEEKLRELNRIIKHAEWIVETGIATGNSLANSAPGMGLGWSRQLLEIQKSRRNLWVQYHDKYKELSTTRLDKAIDILKDCNRNYNSDGGIYFDIDALKKSALKNNPEIATPIF